MRLDHIYKIFAAIILPLLFLLFSAAYADGAIPIWAKSVTTGPDSSGFNSVAIDSSGNIYTAGTISGTGTYDFGNGVTVAGMYSTYNIVLVKYNSSGTPQWAQSVTAGPNGSGFNSVAVDSSGNIYAAGFIYGTGTYNFGNGVTVAGTSSSNIVLVKYSSSGIAQWAKSVTAGPDSSGVNSVAVDSSGNIYTAGTISGTGTYDFGNGVTVAGTSSYNSIVLVKYNSSGTAQWVKSTTNTSSLGSYFNSLAIDSSNNIYAVGWILGGGTYDFGNSVTVAGTVSNNQLIIKYNSSGAAQWARNVTGGSGPNAHFDSIVLDLSGNIYVAGSIGGPGISDFGNGVTIAGTSSPKIVLVKYNSSGTAQWAKSTTNTSSLGSGFKSIAIDSSGNIYAAGFIYGTNTYNFGNGITVAGTGSNYNIVLVEYNSSSGTVQCAQSVTAGTADSIFKSVAVDSSGNIYTAGLISGTGTYNFGNGITAAGTGSSGYSVVLVKYEYGDLAPTITNISKSTYENAAINFNVVDFTNNFNSPTCNSLNKVKIVSLPTNGILPLVNVNQEIPASNLNNLFYIPNTGYIGNDNFLWNASDGTLYATSAASVNIAINDQAPTITTVVKNGFENGTIAFAQSDFTNNFHGYQSNSLNNIVIATLPSNGSLKLSNTAVTVNQVIPASSLGNLTYTPNAGYIGSDSFTWNGSDGYMYAASATNANITINDQAPTLTNTSKSGYENAILNFAASDFTSNFNGYQGNSLNKIKIISLPFNGTLKLSGTAVVLNQEILVSSLGNLTYTPNTNYAGSDGFTWNGSDGYMYAINPTNAAITVSQSEVLSSSSGTFSSSSTGTAQPTTGSSSGLSTGEIVAAAVVPTVGIASLIGAGYWWYAKNHHKAASGIQLGRV